MVEEGIIHRDEEEAGGRGGGASGSAITSGEQSGDGAGVEPVSAALDEGSNQVAHHVVEESVGGDAVDEEAAGGVPLGVGDGADGFRGTRVAAVGEVGVGGGEGGEVMGADDVRSGLVEGGQIHRPRTGPDGGGESGRTDGFLPHLRSEMRGTRFEGWSA